MPTVIFINDEEFKFRIFALVAKLTFNDQSNNRFDSKEIAGRIIYLHLFKQLVCRHLAGTFSFG